MDFPAMVPHNFAKLSLTYNAHWTDPMFILILQSILWAGAFSGREAAFFLCLSRSFQTTQEKIGCLQRSGVRRPPPPPT